MTMAMTMRTIIMMMTMTMTTTTKMIVLMSFYETIVLGVRQSLIFLC